MQDSIFIKSFGALKKLGLSFAKKKFERNPSVIAILKGSGFEFLYNDFESIYAHALVEYIIDADDSERENRELWFQYFGLAEVRDIIKKYSSRGEEDTRDDLLDDNLNTGKTEVHILLKNAGQQTRNLVREFDKLEKHYQKKLQDAGKKDRVQHKQIELSNEILEEIYKIQKELLTIQKTGDDNYKIEYAGKMLEANLQEMEAGFQTLKQNYAEILLAIKELSEQKPELVELKQVAEKIYNIGKIQKAEFKAEDIQQKIEYVHNLFLNTKQTSEEDDFEVPKNIVYIWIISTTLNNIKQNYEIPGFNFEDFYDSHDCTLWNPFIKGESIISLLLEYISRTNFEFYIRFFEKNPIQEDERYWLRNLDRAIIVVDGLALQGTNLKVARKFDNDKIGGCIIPVSNEVSFKYKRNYQRKSERYIRFIV